MLGSTTENRHLEDLHLGSGAFTWHFFSLGIRGMDQWRCLRKTGIKD